MAIKIHVGIKTVLVAMHIKYTTQDVITTNSLIYCMHRHYLPGGAYIYCPRFSFSVNGLPTMSRTSRRILQSENNSLRVIIIKELSQRNSYITGCEKFRSTGHKYTNLVWKATNKNYHPKTGKPLQTMLI